MAKALKERFTLTPEQSADREAERLWQYIEEKEKEQITRAVLNRLMKRDGSKS